MERRLSNLLRKRLYGEVNQVQETYMSLLIERFMDEITITE